MICGPFSTPSDYGHDEVRARGIHGLADRGHPHVCRLGAEVTAYNLSNIPPLVSMCGVESVTLLVGLDEDGPDGALKVYLGARYKRVHLLVTDEAEKENFRRAWGTGRHVWMWPVPSQDDLYVDALGLRP